MFISASAWRCVILTLSLCLSAVVIAYAIYLTLTPIAVTTLLPSNNSNDSRASATLQFVVAVSRHGNRGPLFTFPTYAYQANDTTYWPYGEGELTLHGRLQMFRVGIKLRRLYNGFLNQFYYNDEFATYSTVVDRTLMSGEELLAGLFLPMGFQLWNRSILWQPVPLFPTYLDHSTIVSPDDSGVCPQFQADQNESLLLFQEDYSSNISSLVDYINQYSGLKNVTDTYTLLCAWESFFCADNEDLALPEWAYEIYPEPMTSMLAKLYDAYSVGTDRMVRLLQGQLFQEIIGYMEGKVNGTLDPDRGMFYYSGHDYTILGLTGMFGQATSLGIVNTGSVLLYELHKDLQTDEYFVQVLYINGNSTELEPVPLNITGCGDPCYFYDFKNLTQKFFNITDYDEECQID